jgi:hypothetical protein
MKCKAIVWAALAAAVSVAGGDVAGASAVYIMPMSNGLDQFLALRITTGGVMQVVTDPMKADVVLTDRVGSGFDEKWNELYPPPKPAKSDDKDSKNKDKDKDDVYAIQRGASQPSTRSRGAIFLIERSTRNVLWSTYVRPKTTAPDDMNHTADLIAKELARARKGTAK